MYRCPECGKYLNFKLIYSSGYPIVHWICYCGYDSAKQKIIYSTNTKIIDEKYKDDGTVKR